MSTTLTRCIAFRFYGDHLVGCPRPQLSPSCPNPCMVLVKEVNMREIYSAMNLVVRSLLARTGSVYKQLAKFQMLWNPVGGFLLLREKFSETGIFTIINSTISMN